MMFMCPKENAPTGEVVAAHLPKTRLPVQVCALSADALTMTFNAHGTLPRMGDRARGTLSLPGVGVVQVRGKITDVRCTDVTSNQPAIMTMALFGARKQLLAMLGQYTLLHGTCAEGCPSPKSIRRAGLGFTALEQCVAFGPISHPGQMAAINVLRFNVYHDANLLKNTHFAPCHMQDERDTRAEHIVGTYRGQVVATCRAYAPKAHESFEFEEELSPTVTTGLPPRANSIELGRGAIDKAFRGTGIPVVLFRRLTAYAMRTNRRYMVLAAPPGLREFYQLFGFEMTGISYLYPGSAGFTAQVMVADLHSLWSGDKGNLLTWYVLFGQLRSEAVGPFYQPHNLRERLRVQALRRLGPITYAAQSLLGVKKSLAPHPFLKQ
jgi:predicted GNAT family N-acyltransferase